MNSDVIKEFLVGLGFKIDDAGLAAFGEAVGSASLKAAALGATVVAAGAAVMAGIQNIADEFYQLDRLATQFRTTADAIDEFADIGKILGFFNEQTIGGLKALDRAIGDTALGMGRAKMVFEEMGLSVLDANGKMRSTTDVMDDLAIRFKDMERGKAMRIMERLGLDPAMIEMFEHDFAELRKELTEIDKAVGFDFSDAVAEGKAFAESWRAIKREVQKAKIVFETLTESIAVKMMPKFRAGLDQFKMQLESMRRMIMENMDKIRKVITTFMDIIFRAVEFVTAVAYRIISVVSSIVSGVIALWSSLGDTTQNVILGIAAIGLAWKYLNLAFLATPLGQIIALAAAVALLVDDFLTWQEGGDSLIDWGTNFGQVLKYVVGAVLGLASAYAVVTAAMWAWAAGTTALTAIMGAFNSIMAAVRTAVVLFNLVLYANPIGLVIAAIVALIAAGALLVANWDTVKAWFGSFFDWLLSGFDKVAAVASKVAGIFGQVLKYVVGAVTGLASAYAVVTAAMWAWAAGTTALTAIMGAFNSIMAAVRTAVVLFNLVMFANPIGLVIAAIAALIVAGGLLIANWDTVKAWFSSFFDWLVSGFDKVAGIASKVASVFGFGGDIKAPGSQGALVPSPQAAAAVTGGQQHVTQKTDIIVQGSTDPASTAKAVAGEQGRVNGDMARNMKGAAR